MMISAASVTGRRKGKTTWRYTRHSEAPSIRAASRSSSGTPRKPARKSAITYPESAQTAGKASAGAPHSGCCHHWFERNPTPSLSKTTFSPDARSPGAGFISQRQTIPDAMNETAIGKR